MADQKQTKSMEKQLTKIVKKDGFVTPSKLLEVSTPENSPTHGCFEWDNKAAGNEYRLIQARHWIRIVPVSTVDFEGNPVRVNLVHVPIELGQGEGEYKPINVIVESPSEFERALNAAIADLESAQRRVAELKEAVAGLGDQDKSALLSALYSTLSTARDILQKMQ